MVLAAHGTRDSAGVRVIGAIARRVRRAGIPVRVGYADVRRPSVAEVVTPGCVVVPAFLAAGYHVRVDLPEQLAGTGAVLAPHLGTSLVPAAFERLREAGWRPRDAVVLAAAGSSDERALAEVRQAALLLGEWTGSEVSVGYVAGTAPKVAEVVAAQRGRVAVASWLLAPGLFHHRVLESGADVVAAPIGDHPLVAEELLARYRLTAASRMGA